jgi:hypothetical protein
MAELRILRRELKLRGVPGEEQHLRYLLSGPKASEPSHAMWDGSERVVWPNLYQVDMTSSTRMLSEAKRMPTNTQIISATRGFAGRITGSIAAPGR